MSNYSFSIENEGYGDVIFSMSLQNEEARLKLLASTYDSFSKQHFKKLKKLGLTEQSKCLDIGSGYGSIPLWLASPQGGSALEVVALDKDITVIEKYLTNVKNIKIVQGNINEIEHYREYFDYIHIRFVLNHLPNRSELIGKLKTWLKPGGWLTITDFIWDEASLPESNHKILMKEMWSILQQRIGNNPYWILESVPKMNQLGFEELIYETHSENKEIIDTLTLFWEMTLMSMKKDIMEQSNITEEVFESGIKQTRKSLLMSYQPQVVSVSGRVAY